MDALSTTTKLINSPPGQLAAGGVLAAFVWKFFERVEVVLNDDTKLEIAVWLLDLKTQPKVPWPETFTRLFERLFGQIHFSLRCFLSSATATLAITLLWAPYYALAGSLGYFAITETIRYAFQFTCLMLVLSIVTSVVPDYFSLGATRIILDALTRTRRVRSSLLLLVAGLFATVCFSILTIVIWLIISNYFAHAFGMYGPVPKGLVLTLLDPRSFDTVIWGLYYSDGPLWFVMWVLPSIFTSIWLWLYAGSGFLLKAARRFDLGFDWFNRKVDIEKKPLQAIGLVAGSLVAVVYWAAVIVSRMVG